MKASPARLSTAILSLVLLALAAPRLREQARLYAEIDALLLQGTTSLSQGRIDEAERAWQTAARSAPQNPTVQHALGALYLSAGRWAEARHALNRFADLAPTEPHSLCELAERELSSGSSELLAPASEDAFRAAALEPTCLRAQSVAANAWLARGDTRRGIDYLRRTAALDPGTPSIKLRLGRLLLREQRLPEATSTATQLTQRYPGWSAAIGLLGECYAQKAPESLKGRAAEPTLLRSIQSDPLNGEAHAALGRLLMSRGRAEQAAKHLEAAQELGMSDLSIVFNLGRAYRSQGRIDEATRAEAEFRRRSVLESELGALEKRWVASPSDTAILGRLAHLARELPDPERLARYRRLAAPARPGSRP